MEQKIVPNGRPFQKVLLTSAKGDDDRYDGRNQSKRGPKGFS